MRDNVEFDGKKLFAWNSAGTVNLERGWKNHQIWLATVPSDWVSVSLPPILWATKGLVINHEIWTNIWTQYGTNNFLGPQLADRGMEKKVVLLHYEILWGSLRSTKTLSPFALILMGDWCGEDHRHIKLKYRVR
jgi:hypothetical protein